MPRAHRVPPHPRPRRGARLTSRTRGRRYVPAQVCLLLIFAAAAASAAHLRSGSRSTGHKIAPGSPSAKWVAGGVHKAHCVDDSTTDAGDLLTKRWPRALGVQCCDKHGKASRPQCLSGVTYEEAFEHCKRTHGRCSPRATSTSPCPRSRSAKCPSENPNPSLRLYTH